jgi:DNA-binding transcriptional LysR family regulator
MAKWPSNEVRTIRNEKIAVLASPKLLEKRPIRAVADLLDCNLILSEATLIKRPQMFAQHGLSRPQNPYTLSFDRSYMTLEAANHGLGFCPGKHAASAGLSGAWRAGRGSSRVESPHHRTPPGFPESAFKLPTGQKTPGVDAEGVGSLLQLLIWMSLLASISSYCQVSARFWLWLEMPNLCRSRRAR